MDCAAAAEDGQFVRGLRNEQVRMKGRTRHEDGETGCYVVVFLSAMKMRPLLLHSLPLPTLFQVTLFAGSVCHLPPRVSAASLMYALRPSGGNPAETKVKQEEHHGRRAERARGDQPEQRDPSERKEERLAKDRKRLISVILLPPPRQDGGNGGIRVMGTV